MANGGDDDDDDDDDCDDGGGGNGGDGGSSCSSSGSGGCCFLVLLGNSLSSLSVFPSSLSVGGFEEGAFFGLKPYASSTMPRNSFECNDS